MGIIWTGIGNEMFNFPGTQNVLANRYANSIADVTPIDGLPAKLVIYNTSSTLGSFDGYPYLYGIYKSGNYYFCKIKCTDESMTIKYLTSVCVRFNGTEYLSERMSYNNYVTYNQVALIGELYYWRSGAHDYFETETELDDALNNYIPPVSSISITYTTIGCTLDGPSEAESGKDVSVIVTPEAGRIIREPIQGKSISVYDKNGYIPFTYTDGNLSFKVP